MLLRLTHISHNPCTGCPWTLLSLEKQDTLWAWDPRQQCVKSQPTPAQALGHRAPFSMGHRVPTQDLRLCWPKCCPPSGPSEPVGRLRRWLFPQHVPQCPGSVPPHGLSVVPAIAGCGSCTSAITYTQGYAHCQAADFDKQVWTQRVWCPPCCGLADSSGTIVSSSGTRRSLWVERSRFNQQLESQLPSSGGGG